MNRFKILSSLAVGTSAISAGSFLKYSDTREDFGSQPKVAKVCTVNERIIAEDGMVLSRFIESPWDKTGLKLRLYQYQTCPFCSKVRAFLDFHGFSYEVVEVNPVTRRQLKFSEYKKVPVVVAQGLENKQLNDSVFIVSLLKTFLYNSKLNFGELLGYYPHHKTKNDSGKDVVEVKNKYFVMFNEQIQDKAGIENKKRERQWREWVDGIFIHTISPNVYRTPGESIQTFNWFSSVGDWDMNFPWWERILAVYVGAAAMYVIAKRLKKKHNLKGDVRQSMFQAGNTWVRALGDKPYMGGDSPDLADLALYGAMTSFEGCETMQEFRAAVPGIAQWFDRMKTQVKLHAGSFNLAGVSI